MKQKILKFSEYRIKNALFLQERAANLKPCSDGLEYLILWNYYQYLIICQVKNIKEIYDEFYNLGIVPRYSNFKQETLDNLTSIVEEIVNRLTK